MSFSSPHIHAFFRVSPSLNGDFVRGRNVNVRLGANHWFLRCRHAVVFWVSTLTLRFDFLKKYTIKMFVIARLFVKRRLRQDPNARNSDTSVTVQCSLRNACHSGERVRLELVLCLLWRPWYSLQAALRAATSWTRPARPATFTPRGLPLNPIGPEPGWRKLHWEIDWPNPIIIRISQRGLTDCLWNLQTFSSPWGFLLLVKSNVNVCYLMNVNPIVVP